MLVAYDGTEFHGFAEQPGPRTVGGELRTAIEQVVQHPVELTCAGRTDKGVHAWGQVVSLDLDIDLDLDALHRSLLKLCGPEIVVREVTRAVPDFDARFDARSRTYRYTVVNRPLPDPFLGEHDFSAFCRRPKPAPGGEPVSLVRRVLQAGWTDLGDGVLRFEITASAFCHQMVRSVVGTVVSAGHGGVKAGDIRGILLAGDRAQAAPLAPPHGLCLWHVDY